MCAFCMNVDNNDQRNELFFSNRKNGIHEEDKSIFGY